MVELLYSAVCEHKPISKQVFSLPIPVFRENIDVFFIFAIDFFSEADLYWFLGKTFPRVKTIKIRKRRKWEKSSKDFADSAYDAEEIKAVSEKMGYVPVIDP